MVMEVLGGSCSKEARGKEKQCQGQSSQSITTHNLVLVGVEDFTNLQKGFSLSNFP